MFFPIESGPSSIKRAPPSKGWANSRSLYIGPFQFNTLAKTQANCRAKTRANKNYIELPPWSLRILIRIDL